MCWAAGRSSNRDFEAKCIEPLLGVTNGNQIRTYPRGPSQKYKQEEKEEEEEVGSGCWTARVNILRWTLEARNDPNLEVTAAGRSYLARSSAISASLLGRPLP